MPISNITAASRVLKQRLKDRKLPTMEVPSVDSAELARSLESIREHFRMYEGDSGAPKERFVTMSELEKAGLIKSDVKSGFAYISQVVGQDVAQEAGSTSKPTLRDPVKKDTSRTGRIPGGGSGGAGGKTPSGVSGTGTTQKLGQASDVKVQKPAQSEFLFYDGGKWTNFPLFTRPNRWQKQQIFDQPFQMLAKPSGPEGLTDYGFLWTKEGTPTTLYFTDSAGTEWLIPATGSSASFSGVTITDTAPKLIWYESDASLDNKLWDMVAETEQFRFRIRADDDSTGANIFTVDRTGSTQIDNITLYTNVVVDTDGTGPMISLSDGAGADGDVLLKFDTDRAWQFMQGSSGASTSLILRSLISAKNFYIQDDLAANSFTFAPTTGNFTATGIVAATGGSSTDWNSAFGWGDHSTAGYAPVASPTFTTTVNSPYYQATELGPNTSPGTDDLYIGGYGIMGDRAAAVYVTNATGPVQINAGGVHGAAQQVAEFDTDQVYIEPPSTVAGTAALHVRNSGTANKIARFQGDSDALDIETISAGDYKIRNSAQDNYISFSDGTQGVDIGYNGSLRIEMDSGNDVALYYNGVEEFHTADSDATGQTSGANVKAHNQTFYDVGFNLLPDKTNNASFSITAVDAGFCSLKTTTTARTVTLYAGTNTDFPNGAVFTYFNAFTSGNVTINASTNTATLYWLDGSTRQGGSGVNRTVGPGGVVSIRRHSSTTYYIWGSGIS